MATGGSLLDAHTATAFLNRHRSERNRDVPLATLSDQERVVIDLIGEGMTNRQIGQRMGLAEITIKNYVSHVLAKLGMQRRTQAAILSAQLRPATHRIIDFLPGSGPRRGTR